MRRQMTALTAALGAPACAAPQCEIGKVLELPVQITGRQAIVTSRINGREVRFILDSGASFSTLSRAAASELGLIMVDAPARLHLQGIAGEAKAEVTTVPAFELGGLNLPQVQFLVTDSGMGAAGLLGQNLLGQFDVEYDLPHGMVRFVKARGCPATSAAYWADGRPVTLLHLEPRSPPMQVHTMGTIALDGRRIMAVFDSGAQFSILTAAAARRAGVAPDSPGVVPAGFSSGIGSGIVQTWMGTFGGIAIGDERIPSPRIRFGDVRFGFGDLLVGFDFFLTHRILVQNDRARMFFTYEGGPVFGAVPTVVSGR